MRCFRILMACCVPWLVSANSSILVVTSLSEHANVALPYTPSTGYRNYLYEYDTQQLGLVSHQIIHQQKDQLGAPGYEQWHFQVLKSRASIPFATTIRFVTLRPWKSREKIIKHSVLVIYQPHYVQH